MTSSPIFERVASAHWVCPVKTFLGTKEELCPHFHRPPRTGADQTIRSETELQMQNERRQQKERQRQEQERQRQAEEQRRNDQYRQDSMRKLEESVNQANRNMFFGPYGFDVDLNNPQCRVRIGSHSFSTSLESAKEVARLQSATGFVYNSQMNAVIHFFGSFSSKCQGYIRPGWQTFVRSGSWE
jgi:hypothetical protein